VFAAQGRAFVAAQRPEIRGQDVDAINPDAGWGLVVEQEAGDSVVIAGDIEIVLLGVKGDRAHISLT
jgi:hypothetical protein